MGAAASSTNQSPRPQPTRRIPMKRIISLLLLAVVAISLSSCATTSENTASTAATSAAATASPAENVEQALIKLEREWAEALVRADGATLDRIQADDWIM